MRDAAMNILLVNHEYPPLEGGAAQVAHCVARALVQAGHRVTAVTAGEPGRSYAPEMDGVRVLRAPVPGCSGGAASSFQLLRFARAAYDLALQTVRAEKFDIVHALFGIPGGTVAMKLRAATGLPYIVSMQGSDVPGFRHSPVHPAYLGALFFLFPVWRDAPVLTANSDALRELARFWWKGPIEVVPNGVDAERFALPRAARSDGPLTILMVNQLIPRKNVGRMIAMLPELERKSGRALRLRIIGRGKLQDELTAQVRALGIESSVHFAGHVPPDRMPEEYERADVFALVSQREGMSIALLEAMAAGLPCVATYGANAGRLIEPGANGVLISERSEGDGWRPFADLLRDDALRHRIAAAAREKVATQYAWTAVAAHYLRLYDRARA